MPSSIAILSQKGGNCALQWVTSVLDIVKKVLSSVTFSQNIPFNILEIHHSFCIFQEKL